jgi:hypothetical protein
MTDPHVVTGLMTKRAELKGLLEHHQAKVRQLMIAEPCCLQRRSSVHRSRCAMPGALVPPRN